MTEHSWKTVTLFIYSVIGLIIFFGVFAQNEDKFHKAKVWKKLVFASLCGAMALGIYLLCLFGYFFDKLLHWLSANVSDWLASSNEEYENSERAKELKKSLDKARKTCKYRV